MAVSPGEPGASAPGDWQPPGAQPTLSDQGGTIMSTQHDGVAWEASLDGAKERAQREGKPLLLDFTAAPM